MRLADGVSESASCRSACLDARRQGGGTRQDDSGFATLFASRCEGMKKRPAGQQGRPAGRKRTDPGMVGGLSVLIFSIPRQAESGFAKGEPATVKVNGVPRQLTYDAAARTVNFTDDKGPQVRKVFGCA